MKVLIYLTCSESLFHALSLQYYNKSHVRNSTNMNSQSAISSCILNQFESVTPSNKIQATTLHGQRVKKQGIP